MADEHDHIIDTGKGSLSLEQLGHVLPGMAEIMPLVGDRIWKCYHAARARNKALSRFELSEAVNLMQKAGFLRPKYADDLEKFITTEVAAVRSAIEAEDWDSFEETFREMVSQANAYHELYEKRFICWRVPDSPPPDMDMSPR